MISQKIIDKTLKYFNKYSGEEFVVKPSLPILYFGDLVEYEKSIFKILTVGKNPSDNEFKLTKDAEDFSYCRFPKWNPDKLNLTESLNSYFEDTPLGQWFSSLEPILNGMDSSFYKGKFQNRALHTDICSPLATNPTWSLLSKERQKLLFEEGVVIWKELINELQPDVMLISVPINLFKKIIPESGDLLISFGFKKDGTKRKKDYEVFVYNHKLPTGKTTKVIFGQAANTPFGTITNEQKNEIGEIYNSGKM